MGPAPQATVEGSRLPFEELVALGRNDASLNDIASLSEERLVAVGDRGTVLMTGNGGRSWEPQDVPTTANLQSVAFSSRGWGLIVGGWIGRDTRTSHAVILRRESGGVTWTPVSVSGLPRLQGVSISDAVCVAWGDYSPKHQTSVFASYDEGLTWQPAASGLVHATAAGVAANGNVLAVDQLGRGGLGGAGASIDGGLSLFPLPNVTTPDQPLSCVLATDQGWLAGGAGGELIRSASGADWADVDIPLSPLARGLCHWRGMQRQGDQVWVCGHPGSIVLHSRDQGRQWRLLPTGQSLPLAALHFVDYNRGWAVGPLGLILATRDGGETWYAQRQRARRVGVLSLGADSRELPWAPLVAAVWDEQVAVAACFYRRLQPISQADYLPTADSQRSEAARQLGLANCQLNFQSPTAPTAALEQAALDVLTWRPDILLVDGQPHSGLPHQSALAASASAVLKLASGPSLPWMQELGVSPWNVSKLAETCSGDDLQYMEQTARVLRQPGIAIWDCLLPLSDADRQRAQRVAMRTLWTNTQSKSAHASLMGGVAPSGETERQVSIRNIGNYQLLMGRVHRGQSIQQLAQIPAVQKPLDQWRSDLDFVLDTVPAHELVPLLQVLAAKLSLDDHWDKRRLVYQRLMEQGQSADAAAWGRLEWSRLEWSDERRAWMQSSQRQTNPRPVTPTGSVIAAAQAEPWNASPFGPAKEPAAAVQAAYAVGEGSAVVPAAATSRLPVTSDQQTAGVANSPGPLANNPADSLEQMRPDVQLLRYSAQRRGVEPAERSASLATAQALAACGQLIGWPQMAAQELALASDQTDTLRWTALARSAAQPPLLDGRLDDACWQYAAAMELTALADEALAASPPPPATIRWAYDANYLYIAIDCPHQAGTVPAAPAQHREYDADLNQVDHVHLLLDTDRDYNTAVELAVSADGRTYDRCCGASEFNPKWHVSVASHAATWTAEVAIAVDQLTTQALPQQAWAISARRQHPSGISQSWSQLRSHAPYLQASGLLRFVP